MEWPHWGAISRQDIDEHEIQREASNPYEVIKDKDLELAIKWQFCNSVCSWYQFGRKSVL